MQTDIRENTDRARKLQWQLLFLILSLYFLISIPVISSYIMIFTESRHIMMREERGYGKRKNFGDQPGLNVHKNCCLQRGMLPMVREYSPQFRRIKQLYLYLRSARNEKIVDSKLPRKAWRSHGIVCRGRSSRRQHARSTCRSL